MPKLFFRTVNGELCKQYTTEIPAWAKTLISINRQKAIFFAERGNNNLCILKTKDEIIAVLRKFKEEFGERYGIERLGLFGSVARDEQKEDSGIDICVQLQTPDYFTRMEIKESLEQRLEVKVDVISLTAIMRSLFRKHIEKDAIYI